MMGRVVGNLGGDGPPGARAACPASGNVIAA